MMNALAFVSVFASVSISHWVGRRLSSLERGLSFPNQEEWVRERLRLGVGAQWPPASIIVYQLPLPHREKESPFLKIWIKEFLLGDCSSQLICPRRLIRTLPQKDVWNLGRSSGELFVWNRSKDVSKENISKCMRLVRGAVARHWLLGQLQSYFSTFHPHPWGKVFHSRRAGWHRLTHGSLSGQGTFPPTSGPQISSGDSTGVLGQGWEMTQTLLA